MKKLILLTALTLTSTATFAWSECSVGEVRAFSETATPDKSAWMKADGSTLLNEDYQLLSSFIGGTYGKNDESHFTLPKINDLSLNGKSYPYYICVNGPMPGRNDTNTSYITQFPAVSRYDEITEGRNFATMQYSFFLPAMQFVAFTTLMPDELIVNHMMTQIPQVIFPEVVENGPEKLQNYITLNGYYPSSETLYNCEKGGLYFTFMKKPVDANANYKEIIADKPFAQVLKSGQKMNIQPRIMECLKNE